MSLCYYLAVYLLWMLSCSDCWASPEKVIVKSLECIENVCEELNYPLDSQVAYFSNEISSKLGNYTTFVLHNSQLNHLPLNVFRSLKNLANFDVYDCEVRHVSHECFRGAINLRMLQLGGNLIEHLDADTFSLATQLEELGLADNKLEELPAKGFNGLTKLQKLSLQGNRLKMLSADVFSQLKHLQYINLDYNQLTKLPAKLCADQQDLQYFTARGNELKEVASNTFFVLQRLVLSDNPQLQSLHLSAKIHQLQIDDCELKSLRLDKPQELQQLLLSNSRLSSFDFLRNAKNLLELDLSGLKRLPTLPLPWPAQKLERLTISQTSFGDWPEKMLSQLKQLKYLDILHDQEHEIYVKDEDQFGQQQSEQLEDSDWICAQLQLLKGDASNSWDYAKRCPVLEEEDADELLWTGDGFEII